MESSIGLLIVHGIGNQQAGTLTNVVASSLAGTAVRRNTLTAFLNRTLRGRLRDKAESECADPQTIEINGVPVLIHEANWAPLSHPDNPPYIRYNTDIQSEFFKTVRAAWYFARDSFGGSKTLKPDSKRNSMAFWLVVAATFAAIGLTFLLVAPFRLLLFSFLNKYGMGTFGLLLSVWCCYSLFNAIRRWNRERQAGGRPGWNSLVLGFCQPMFFFWGAALFLFFSIPVFVAYPLNAIGWLLVWPFRCASLACAHYRLRSIRRWLHRIGWITIGMPVLSAIQSVKAAGNLFSVLFTEKGRITRMMALLGMFEVYLAAVALMIICEVILLPIVMPFFVFELDALNIFLLVFGYLLYLVLARVSLPVIDLILDVANYGVASCADRQKYYKRMDTGVATLRSAGCTEIQILAHSLGSVIVYDWLKARSADSHPIAVLHTIGSPLDKFWYIDHTQEQRLHDHQGLKNLVSRAWINYWAYSDPVSGELNHYDAPELQVANKRIPWLGIYISSHARYWRNKKVVNVMREWIVKSSNFAPAAV